jgi:hypothetical protein
MGTRVNAFDRKFNGIEDFVGRIRYFELEVWFGENRNLKSDCGVSTCSTVAPCDSSTTQW